MKQKIILGTVQLGLPYGINNKSGKPSFEDAFKILNLAFENNIGIVDTADDYGESVQVIGRHRSETGKEFSIINKFKLDTTELSNKLSDSLQKLRADSLFCYMYHNFEDYRSGSARNQLRRLKEDRRIEKIGVSLYNSEQLKLVIPDPDIDIIQLPVNILDNNHEKQSLLKAAKSLGKKIHARSVFLQGLFFKSPSSLTGNLKALRPYLETLSEICNRAHISVEKAALNYVLCNENIDQVVLGIEHVSQLRHNLNAIDTSFNPGVLAGIEVKDQDLFLLNPANWRP